MTEMESPLEDYAEGLGFHFDSYFIWRLLYRRIGDALSKSIYFLFFSELKKSSNMRTPSNMCDVGSGIIVIVLMSLAVSLLREYQ